MRRILVCLILSVGLIVSAGELRFSGVSKPVIKVDVERNTGLSGVYVATDCAGLVVDCGDRTAVWHKYGDDWVTDVVTIGRGASVKIPEGGGYGCEVGGRTTYFWVVDYSAVRYAVTGLELESMDCSTVWLRVSGECPALSVRSLSGRVFDVDRGVNVSYNTLVETDGAYIPSVNVRKLSSADGVIVVESPLCPTGFTISGDRFLREWREESVVESGIVYPMAVSAIINVVQRERDVANEQHNGEGQTGVFGGSAPVEIDFSASVSDGAVFTEWQMSGDPEFGDIQFRENSLNFSHTFNESGTIYVRFICANSDGSCDWVSEVMSVRVGESSLRCPNAFSPGVIDGVNDEWRVSFKSIVEFDCGIFDRLGTRLCVLTDPSRGWDGRYKGKLVRPGVYYYVIKARGADGKVYNLAGDINIVGAK